MGQDGGGHDFVGLGQVVLGAKETNVGRGNTTAAAGEWDVVVVVKIVIGATLHTATAVPLPHLALHFARELSGPEKRTR